MRRLPRAPAWSLLAAVALTVHCGGGQAPVDPPPASSGSAAVGPSPAPPPGAEGKVDDGTRGNIRIADAILKACGTVPAANFEFDSASVSQGAQAAFAALAKCFTTGPLQGKAVKLVGHTDNRGEVNYNIGLGQRRAGSVGNLLRGFGVPAAKVIESSAGEFEANGEDEAGWARDRRVDVSLAE